MEHINIHWREIWKQAVSEIEACEPIVANTQENGFFLHMNVSKWWIFMLAWKRILQ